MFLSHTCYPSASDFLFLSVIYLLPVCQTSLESMCFFRMLLDLCNTTLCSPCSFPHHHISTSLFPSLGFPFCLQLVQWKHLFDILGESFLYCIRVTQLGQGVAQRLVNGDPPILMGIMAAQLTILAVGKSFPLSLRPHQYFLYVLFCFVRIFLFC